MTNFTIHGRADGQRERIRVVTVGDMVTVYRNGVLDTADHTANDPVPLLLNRHERRKARKERKR